MKISPEIKAIADRHIAARAHRSNVTFDVVPAHITTEILKQDMLQGKTYEGVILAAESAADVSTTSVVLAALGAPTKVYTKAIYRMFKKLYGEK